MTDAMSAKLLDLVAQMEDYVVLPNMASFNLVLKAMHKAKETVAAIKLLKGLAIYFFFINVGHVWKLSLACMLIWMHITLKMLWLVVLLS